MQISLARRSQEVAQEFLCALSFSPQSQMSGKISPLTQMCLSRSLIDFLCRYRENKDAKNVREGSELI